MTATAALTYYAYDFLTGAALGQLPLRGVSFGSSLNNPGRLQASLDLTDPRVQLLNPLLLTTPMKTALVVDYGGAIVWAGLVQTRRWEVAAGGSNTSRSFPIQATELWSYFQQRVQATDYSAPPYSGIYPNPATMPIWDAASAGSTWDPLLIAWQVIADALSYRQSAPIPNGNPLGGISIAANFCATAAAYLASGSNTPSGDYINITYPFTSLQSIDSIVTQLSQLGFGVGFDFGVDMAYSGPPGTPPVATINLSYPRRGRMVAQNNLWVDLSTARGYSFPEDGTQMADVVYETGGSGAISVSENIFVLESGYATFERVFQRAQLTSANVMALLGQVAYTDLYQFSYPPVTPQVTLGLFDTDPSFGSFITGDDIMVLCPQYDQTGGVFDYRFPGGFAQEWRITEWQAKVPDEGDATLVLTLNQPPVLLPASPAI